MLSCCLGTKRAGGRGRNVGERCGLLAAACEDAFGLHAREFLQRFEIRTLDAGSVSRDALQFGLKFFVIQRGERVNALVERGFEATNAAEIPSVGDHLIEDNLFNAAIRFHFGEVEREEFIELGLLFGSCDDHVFGAQAVSARVGGGASFAFGRARPGALASVLCVGLVGGLARIRLGGDAEGGYFLSCWEGGRYGARRTLRRGF